MTPQERKVIELALEALETCYAGDYSTGHVIDPSFDEDAVKEAIIAIKEALAQPEDKKCENCGEFGECCQDAQPEQEPVYWQWRRKNMPWQVPQIFGYELQTTFYKDSEVRKLYTTPPQRKPLTDDELDLICEKALFCRISFQQFARSIEAAHGIKE